MRLELTNYTLPPPIQRLAGLVTYDSHLMPMPAGCPAPSLPVFSCGCSTEAPLGPQGPTSAHHSPNPDKYHPPPILNYIAPLNDLNSKHEDFQRANPQALWDTPMFEGSDSIAGTRGCSEGDTGHTVYCSEHQPDSFVWLFSTSVGGPGLQP